MEDELERYEAAQVLVGLDQSKAIEAYMSIVTDHNIHYVAAGVRLEAAKELVALDSSYKEMAVGFLQSWVDSSSLNTSMSTEEQDCLEKFKIDLAENFPNPGVLILAA